MTLVIDIILHALYKVGTAIINIITGYTHENVNGGRSMNTRCTSTTWYHLIKYYLLSYARDAVYSWNHAYSIRQAIDTELIVDSS